MDFSAINPALLFASLMVGATPLLLAELGRPSNRATMGAGAVACLCWGAD
ncbi:MAG: hypothetical protein GDA40_03365 [Rhodobacteraceae bacterium]|nr:hypothetical protein [Paracoccaceae bacterium]